MNKQDVATGIRRAWDVVDSLDLGETFSAAFPLPVSAAFRDLVLNPETSYAEIYLNGLSLSHYNFLLSDFSFFQFSWAAQDSVRYAFFPNPFIKGEDAVEDFRKQRELVANGVISMDEYLDSLRDEKLENRVPLFRYENAPGQHRELSHPCSHFHIGHHSTNRWAIRRILTPLGFALLILKHYYSAAWRRIGDDELVEYKNTFERALVLEKGNCRIIGDELFSPSEGRSFFFG